MVDDIISELEESRKEPAKAGANTSPKRRRATVKKTTPPVEKSVEISKAA
ncbi:MAG TPA: hypothetical protein PK529_12145 [Verrucomicrobiales bacterium]|nr:hypothetical protein [Verrucomicrobiales bacterium]